MVGGRGCRGRAVIHKYNRICLRIAARHRMRDHKVLLVQRKQLGRIPTRYRATAGSSVGRRTGCIHAQVGRTDNTRHRHRVVEELQWNQNPELKEIARWLMMCVTNMSRLPCVKVVEGVVSGG